MQTMERNPQPEGTMSKAKEGTPGHWLDLMADTLKHLETDARGTFLQQFLQGLVGREFSEEECINHWGGILARQNQLVEKLGRPVTLGTAAVDYFGELGILRNPVLLEYEELKQLRYNAATDPLTGLANRRMFEEFLNQEIIRANRYTSSFALLALDLRNFKSVNDLYGHAVGDDVLRSVARSSLETIRGSDIPCRTGGDEFTILLPQAERPGSEILAERIARRFEGYARPLAPNAPVGIDYGIAIFPEDGHGATSLLAAADRSLYANKLKAHEQSSNRMVPTRVTAPRAENPVLQFKVEEADHRRRHASAPAATARTGEEIRISENDPSSRRFERIRLDGTPALGIVRVGGQSRTVRVLDASRGGVCLLVDQADLPETFPAFLQVPMLPEGELILHRVYSLPLSEGKRRVGCSFASISAPGSA
jgi:diguanylate cyclase (GGDEF)-like protein